ncbi:hypothetical protein BKA70DRAFT_1566303 [Coprinopsis sp. MPI-PUGE-AT-0042]|nr:hypothetical protein BKA70DRAFT_1566303 [Coprinopsis sp. MPI-PUGE-AT-0042]
MEAEYEPNFFAGFERQISACIATTRQILDSLLLSSKQPFHFNKDRYEDDIKACNGILSAILAYLRTGQVISNSIMVSHNNRWGQVDKKFANDLIQNPDLVELGLRALKLYHYRRASKDTGSVGKNIEEFLGRLSVRGKPLFDQKTMLVCGWPGCKQVYAAKYCVTHFDLFHANPNEVACQHKHCECRVGPLFLPAHLIMRHSQFAC